MLNTNKLEPIKIGREYDPFTEMPNTVRVEWAKERIEILKANYEKEMNYLNFIVELYSKGESENV